MWRVYIHVEQHVAKRSGKTESPSKLKSSFVTKNFHSTLYSSIGEVNTNGDDGNTKNSNNRLNTEYFP